VPRDKVRSFQVQRGGARDDGSLAITVEGRSSPFMIGQTYPSEWLEGVAQALGETHGGARIEEPAQAPPPPAPVAALKVVEVESAPAGTDIVLEYTADAVRLSIPRKGVWKAGGCMIGFGLFWSAISWTVFGAAIASREWGGVAFASLFVAVGTGILLGAVHSGIKTMQIELGGASLVVRKTGLFGKKVEQWLRSSLSGYSIEDSGWEVNDVKQWQIRIDRSDGKPIKLLRGRSTVELNWICSVLRNGPIGRVEAAPSEIKATGAECQVCNAPMTSDIVYCARCKTPHHGQCWQYLGQCSTYGCREIRYTTT
jgi:hypothetical protein